MGNWLQPYIEQLKTLWNNLEKRAKIIIGVGVLSVILALVFLIIWGGGGKDYQPLFTGLNARDADAIVNRLEEEGISYQLANEGKTILVSGANVHKTRLNMAGEGLPNQGVVGFEVFDQSQFGRTDFEREVNFYRALGGELSRSIQAMNNIDFARVQITAPDDSLFRDEAKPAEASVLLKLKTGYKLDNSQVKAISNLVASGVQNLTVDNVTIVDTAGNLLSANTDKGDEVYDGQLTLNQFEIQRQFEKGLENDLRTMLAKVLGPDNFTVQVRAKLDFDQRRVETESYSPVVGEEGIVRSEEEMNESYQGQAGAEGGAPGTSSNIPQYQSPEEKGETGSYEKSEQTTNYEINKKIESHVYAPGEVENLSIAVIVNESMADNNLTKIEESIQAAIGYNPERGDMVTVTDLAFDEELEHEVAEAQAAAQAAQRQRTYIYAGLILFILILLFVGFLLIRRGGQPREQEIAEGQRIDMMVGEEPEEAREQAAAADELSEEEERRKQLKEELTELIYDQPEEVAQVIKSWLMEE